MHDINRLATCLLASVMGLPPSCARAQDGGMAGGLAPVALIAAALFIALVLAFRYRRRLRLADARVQLLANRVALLEAASALRSEHVILW